MAYLAMARKWRPRTFEDMVGQDHIAQTIRNAIEGGRISHAYLFTGTRGVGKTTSARILAKALNCKNGPTAVPCDTCENCKAVNSGGSMDVLEIDGASNNSVDNIRELREQVNYAPMNGSYKIYVIDEVHMLSKSAFNALLKTLEEPPPHVVFIFATTEANKLPHTILSRVQRFDFKRISEAGIRDRLEYICGREGIAPEREALEAIARKADGSMRDALSLFDQVYAFSGAALTMEAARKVLGLPRDGMFDALLRALIQHDQKTCFSALQESHREGIETSELLSGFGEYLRNMLFARQGVAPEALGLGEARHGELCSLAPELRDGDIIRYAKMISDLLAQLKTTANPRLAVELAFARMAALDRVVTLSQVLGQDFSAPAASAPASAAPAASVIRPTPAHPANPPPQGREPDSARPPAARSDLDEVKKKSPLESLSPGAEAAYPESITRNSLPEPAAAAFGYLPGPESGASARGYESVSRPSNPFTVPETGADAQATGPDLMEAGPGVPEAGPGVPEAGPGVPEAGPGVRESASDGIPESDSDMENYSLDPEDPEAAMVPPPPRAEKDEEPQAVPAQASPALLPGVWPSLVGEFMGIKPLQGFHLMQTRMEWEDGDTPMLRVVFPGHSAFNLIDGDADFRKSLQSFLASKVEGGREVPVRFALAEGSGAGDDGMDPLPLMGLDDPARREPIINYIRDVFDGRIIG